MELVPGSLLGSYEVMREVGAGGIGEVYRAHDTRLGDAPIALARDRPRDLGGVTRINLRITPDGEAYAYNYGRTLSELYVIEGLS